MDGSACGRNGCTGVIEDGYCNACGLAAPKAATSTARSAISSSSKGMSNTGSSPSSRAVAAGTRRSSRGSSRGSSRSQLGAGLIQLPELPSPEPEKQLLVEPKVPENKRYCANCEAALSRERGFCGKCGRKYSFSAVTQSRRRGGRPI